MSFAKPLAAPTPTLAARVLPLPLPLPVEFVAGGEGRLNEDEGLSGIIGGSGRSGRLAGVEIGGVEPRPDILDPLLRLELEVEPMKMAERGRRLLLEVRADGRTCGGGIGVVFVEELGIEVWVYNLKEWLRRS